VVLVVVYALIDEYHQSFVPSRTGTIYDSLIDMAGGLTALLVVKRRNWFDSASNSPV
jgi:VanZ family protein